VARLTSLPEAQRAVLADPLVSSWRTPLMVAAAHARLALQAQQRFAAVTYPFQVLHAEADQVTLPAASARLVAAARLAPIRRLRLVSGE